MGAPELVGAELGSRSPQELEERREQSPQSLGSRPCNTLILDLWPPERGEPILWVLSHPFAVAVTVAPGRGPGGADA